MSPDDIFAAQFWPWPDPAIKRDSQGRVLFINAAFLQLYGGTVQDWTGNVVGGWPAPQAPGAPYRFETRMPMTAEMAEQVYDWMEMTLADGNAFAIARNVTQFTQMVAPQAVPEVIADIPPQAAVIAQDTSVNVPLDTQLETLAADVSAPVADVPVAEMAVAEMAVAHTQEMPHGTELTADVVTDPSNVNITSDIEIPQDYALEASHEPVVFAEYTPDSEILAQAPAAPMVEAPVADVPVAAPPVVAAAPAVAAQITQPSNIPPEASGDSDRAYERRALPIENESAVLGNNWRDAVIAKAVGAGAVPAAVGAVAASAAVTTDVGSEGPKRILLAEDNAINALLTRTLLEADGHTVETVEDGVLAVEAMKTSTYDLIFMDMRMPNMDGLEATRKIRTMANVPKDLPIIALTANAFDDDRNACFDSGMNDFMTKPVSAEELSEMVVQWTGQQEERLAS